MYIYCKVYSVFKSYSKTVLRDNYHLHHMKCHDYHLDCYDQFNNHLSYHHIRSPSSGVMIFNITTTSIIIMTYHHSQLLDS